MKKHVVYTGLLLLMVPSIIRPTPESPQEQPYVKPNPKLIKIDRDKWKFLRTTLEFELEQAKGYKNSLGNTIENKSDAIAEMAAAPLTIFAGLFTQQHLMQFLPPDSDHLKYLWISTGILGTLLFYITKLIVPNIGSLLASHGAVAMYALNNFMDGWTDFRAKCPSEVYPLFDILAADYNANDLLTSITDKQALKITQTMLSLASLVERLDGLLLEHTLTRLDETENVYQTFIATNVKSLMPTSRGEDDFKIQRNQWEYLAQQLGILDHPQATTTPIKKFFYEFEVPLVLSLGFPLGAIIGQTITTSSWELTREDTEIIGASQLLGGTIGAMLMSLTSRFVGITDHRAWYKQQLEEFIENWHAHKQRCPTSVVPLFNQISTVYHINNSSLNLDETFIEELYRMIAKIWLKISSAEPENTSEHIKDEL